MDSNYTTESSATAVDVVFDPECGGEIAETLDLYHEKRRHCKRLSLSRCNLQDAGMQRLCQIAQEGPSDVCLRALELSASGITSSSSGSLATLLEISGQTLEEFDLSNNKVKVRGIDKIVQALHSSQRLTRINLSNISLVGKEGARKLGILLQGHLSLQEVRLAKNNLGSKATIDHIYLGCKDNSQLRVLDLSDNKLNDACVNTLAQLFSPSCACELQELDLANTELDSSKKGNCISSTGVLYLKNALIDGSNTSLAVLKLSGNTIGPEGGVVLKSLLLLSHSLTELHLAACGLGDKGVNAICFGLEHAVKVPVLRYLDLTWNLLHDSSAESLAQLLQNSTTLQVLKLQKNGIGDNGATVLAQALPRSHTIVELDLRENLIHDQGAEELALALTDKRWKTPFHLAWDMNRHMTATGCRRLKNAVQARDDRVKWRGCLKFARSNGDDELLEICQTVAVTEPLPMVLMEGSNKGTHLTLRSLEVFRDNVMSPPHISLQMLYFTRINIGNDGARLVADAMVGNQSLTILSCQACGLTSQGAHYISRALFQNQCIRRLDLSENPIGNDGASALFEILQDISSLNILMLRSTGIGDEAISSLSSFGHLLTLNLSDNEVTDVGARALSELCRDPRSSCNTKSTTDNVSGERGFFRPPRICIARNYLTVAGLEALQRVFQTRSSLLECTPQNTPIEES